MNPANNPRNFVSGNTPPNHFPQFERSPESFPDLTIFPPGWDMSELKPIDRRQLANNTQHLSMGALRGEDPTSNGTA